MCIRAYFNLKEFYRQIYEKVIERVTPVLTFTSAKIPSQVTLIMRKYLANNISKL